MTKLTELYKQHKDIFNIIFIALLLILGFVVFKDRFNGLLTDKGREMLFPLAILQGKVLYKDILCIYFPLAFQINAIAYKIFGVHLNTLLFMELFNSFLICSFIYLISKEFTDRKLSFLFAVTYGIAATFNGTLYNILLPYSSSLMYGMSAFLAGVFFLIKYVKTENKNYIYFGYFAGGFAIACKSEFMFLFALLVFTSFFLKPSSLKENIKNLLLYAVMPLISFGILFLQGLTIHEFMSSLDFMHKFFTTDAMIYHVKRTGAIPCMINLKLYIPAIIKLCLLYSAAFLLFKITKKHILLSALAVILSVYVANKLTIGTNTILLPVLMTLFLLVKFRDLIQKKELMIIVLAGIIATVRMYWSLQIDIYGMLTGHLLILAFVFVLFEYLPEFKYLTKDELKKFVIFMTCVYLTFFTAFDYSQMTKNTTAITTERGTVYLPKEKAEAINFAIDYIKQYSTPEQKILFLQEGTALNFLTNRPVDLKLHMADRLYYEAIGADKIIENIDKNDYEMVFVVKGYGLTKFGKEYLYTDDNPVVQFLKQKYVIDWQTNYYDGKSDNIMICYVKPYK